MHKLESAVKSNTPCKKLPTLDDVLDEFVNEVMDHIGTTGDDVADAEEDGTDSSSDDEQYELLNEECEEEEDTMDVNGELLDKSLNFYRC